MSLPVTWSAALGRLARLLGSPEEAEAWLRSAVEARYGVLTLADLDRVGRQVAFQKTCGVVLALEEEGIPEAMYGPDTPAGLRLLVYRDGTIEPASGAPTRRQRVARAFARYFDGVAVDGPDWRIDMLEDDREPLEEWADFGASAERLEVR